MPIESIESKILNKIRKCGSGRYLFASDFVVYGEQKPLSKALEHMAKVGTILRISHGIYFYPKIDKVLGQGGLYLTLEDIAERITNRYKARIVHSGLYVLNRHGFSTQIPMNVVYLTDGFNRKIIFYIGTSIQFKRTAPNNFVFHSQLAMLQTLAYKTLGKGEVRQRLWLAPKICLLKRTTN